VDVVSSETALASLGCRPSVPITKEKLANSELRNSWVRDKGMQADIEQLRAVRENDANK
jgi:hypothetical protein